MLCFNGAVASFPHRRSSGLNASRAGGARTSVVHLPPSDRRGFAAPGAAVFDGDLSKPVRPRSLFERLLASAGPVEAAAAPPAGPP
ncbi:hypothetical protein, partial [Methylobacterium radiotolerans]|uniref:hypothetical protein n=1 Tax=Methylobacterium radiotolerans TaxID=31998 RepID=UPI003F67DE87